MDERSRCRRMHLLASLIIIAVLVTACGSGVEEAEDPLIARGQRLFMGTCAACHGSHGRGMPRLGSDLHDNAFIRGRSDADLLLFLQMGRNAKHPDNRQGVDMPPRGGNPMLTDEELEVLVTYLRLWN